MAAQVARRAEAEKVVPFSVVTGTKEVKLTKAGLPKRTHSNAKEGRSTWVDPIYRKEDIQKVLQYLTEKAEAETRMDYKRGWMRNKLLFVLGIQNGFRISDLLTLTWQDLFLPDGKTFRPWSGITEKKTGKMKGLYNSGSQKYILEYLASFPQDTTKSTLVFTNRQGKQLSRTTVMTFVKEATEAVGLNGNFNTHSIRKTFAYHYFLMISEKEGGSMALAKTQAMLNHLNTATTLKYLGMSQRNTEQEMSEMADYLGI